MIDISTTNKINGKAQKELPKLEKLEGVVLYCEPSMFTYTDDNAYTDIDKDFTSETGYHFVVKHDEIEQYIDISKQTNHLNDGKNTYIERALYQGKTNAKTISILMLLPKDGKYPDIEKKTIKFIANFLLKHDLTVDNLMRGFDLNKLGSPLHLVDKTKWTKFIKIITETYNDMVQAKEDGKDYDDSKLEKATTTYTDKTVREFYLKTGKKADDYIKDHEPDHRDIEAIVNYKADEVDDFNSFTTANSTNFTYSVTENPPTSTSHCSRAFDTLKSKASPSMLEVEPIYPDIVVPPGGTLTLVDSVSSAVNTVVSSSPLSSEEFEKRQQSFNVNDYKDAVKENNGKPVNNNDPFPVDDKIKELESHSPKVKIDEVTFTLNDCNHPGSIIGPAVTQNFAMVQDEIITLAKRTERRLVKLENTMATIMRNLFRVSSRMNVNCVYYGGQDVYGKYKCIRCLHMDRINDGQSMTLDQCLSCTRYEPIIGQVYAILDESGTSISQVIDDMQMAYMSLDEYSDFTRNDIHTARKPAKVTTEGKPPKQFSEVWDEGFKMDWNTTSLEQQRYNVAEYKTEDIEAIKPDIKKDREPKPVEEFKEVVESNEEYETLIYNSDDYKFEGFGEESKSDIAFIGSSSGSVIRQKIVEYAENAVKLCEDGKALYSQDYRYRHLEDAMDGISYWDCSSLVEKAYAAAGITGIGYNTTTEYPPCLPTAGGIVVNVDNIDKALPGDMVWFTTQSPKPSTDEELLNANVYEMYHVGIYVGNGEYIHAATDENPPTRQINKSQVKYGNHIFAFGRPRALVEADAKTVEGSVYDGVVPVPDFNFAGLSEAKKKWLITISELCIKASLKYPELFASVAIIQGAIETGWGQHVVGNNYFGIKADASWTGPIVAAGTSEQNALGQAYHINANFRRYDSAEQSVYDRYQFLVENSNYREAGVFSAKTPEDQIRAMHAAGYATDINYSSMIISEIEYRNAKSADAIVEQLRKKIQAEKQ